MAARMANPGGTVVRDDALTEFNLALLGTLYPLFARITIDDWRGIL